MAAILLSVPIILVVGAVAFGTRSLSLIPLGVTLLVGILPCPGTAGVQVVTREFATSGYATVAEHWAGFRSCFVPACKVWLLSLFVTALIGGNVVFYLRVLGGAAGPLRSAAPGLLLAWILILAFWLALHLYVYPLIILQEVKSVRLVYRNAFMMAVARPGVTALVGPLWIALLLLGSTTGLVTFIGLALGAAIQQNCVARLLPTFRLRAAS